jgi:hypothetical protein
VSAGCEAAPLRRIHSHILQWNYTNNYTSLFWSSAVVDIILVLIALSYTYTAISLFLRVIRSIKASKTTLSVSREDSALDADALSGSGYQLMDSDAEQHAVTPSPGARGARTASTAKSPRRITFNQAASPSASSPLLKHAADAAAVPAASAPSADLLHNPDSVHAMIEGIRSTAGLVEFRKSLNAVMSRRCVRCSLGAFNRRGSAWEARLSLVSCPSLLPACSLYTEESREELRGALLVFITIMLSSALLISLRASLSLAFTGSAEVRLS